MQVNLSQRSIDASQMPVEKLAGNPQLSQAQKLTELSRQFEAVLVRQILSEAQKPLIQSSGAGSAVAGQVYHDMITNQLADQISHSGIGLARGLETQLHRQNAANEAAAAKAQTPTSQVKQP